MCAMAAALVAAAKPLASSVDPAAVAAMRTVGSS